MRPNHLALLWLLAVTACTKENAPPPQVHGAAPVPDAGSSRPVQLTFLFTGAENGYLLPTPGEGGATRGGAAELLARWIADGHCAGPLGADGAPACPDEGTVTLSTGDNANGQAISSYYRGQPVAEVMRQMGYAASALGNRELDWALAQFLANTAKGGFPYLAANLRAKDDEGKKLGLQATRVLTRKGVKVGIVGLASPKSLVTPMPGRMAGLELVPTDVALEESIAALRREGTGIVVVVSDDCLDSLAPLLKPQWNVAVLAGRLCDEKYPEAVGLTKLVYPGRHFNSYVRATVTADLARPAPQQLLAVEARSIEVVNGEGAPAPEPKAKELIAAWKTKLDAALGEPIGFTREGLEQESPKMGAWLTTAIKEQFKADVGLLNRKGVRQSLPPGKVTKASIYDLVPWENEIVVAKVSGEALLLALSNVEARVAGVRPKPGAADGENAWLDAKGAPIDAKKTYAVATTDYLYLGGDGFTLNKADPNPTQTRTSWQAATIEWTKAKKTDEKTPLESLIKVK